MRCSAPRKQNPAAVELHVTMSLLNENRWSQMTLTADTVPEQPYLPSSEALRDDLLLARAVCTSTWRYLGAVDGARVGIS